MALAVTGQSGDMRDARLDAQMIDELRCTRDQLRAPSDGAPWLMKVTLEDVDALLAAVDERDALRREVCGDPAPPFPPVRAVEAVASEGCPRRDIVHDCPLGGCPTPIPNA